MEQWLKRRGITNLLFAMCKKWMYVKYIEIDFDQRPEQEEALLKLYWKIVAVSKRKKLERKSVQCFQQDR
jgi:hypothetical protein